MALKTEAAMIDLGPMTDRFSASGQKVVRRAIEESKQLGHNHLSVEHIFAALCDSETKLVEEAAKAAGVFPLQTVLHALGDELSRLQPYPGPGRGMVLTDSTRDLFTRALKHVKRDGRQKITSADLFFGLFEDQQKAPASIMRRLGADLDRLREAGTQLFTRRVDVGREPEIAKEEKTGQIYPGTEAWMELGKRFSEPVLLVITRAIGEAHRLNHGFLTTTHILWVLWNANPLLFNRSMKEAGVDPETVASIIRYHLERMQPHLNPHNSFYIADDAKIFLDIALDFASKKGREVLEPDDLLGTLLSDTNGIFAEIMNTLWADQNKVVEAITRNLRFYNERLD
jgi:ATP-dependent Clp protease ATP-binding subunit ClpA